MTNPLNSKIDVSNLLIFILESKLINFSIDNDDVKFQYFEQNTDLFNFTKILLNSCSAT